MSARRGNDMTIDHLPDALMQKVDPALKVSLALP
jgi:hypothetical protein